MPVPGTFDVNVFLKSGGSTTLIGDSPYVVDVVSGTFVLENTVIDGQGVVSCGAGVICSFSVMNRDKFKNFIVLRSGVSSISHSCLAHNCDIRNGDFNFNIALYNLDDEPPVAIMLSSANLKVNSEPGKLSVSYQIEQAGQYSWTILISGQPVPGNPYRFSIFGGITSPFTTVAAGRGLECAHPGFPATFVIRTRDQFSNFKTAGGDIVEVVHQCSSFSV
jgi:hypothetical protein